MNEKVSYAMAKAYDKYISAPEAIKAVSGIYPDLSEEILSLMWKTIDAYLDLMTASDLTTDSWVARSHPQ